MENLVPNEAARKTYPVTSEAEDVAKQVKSKMYMDEKKELPLKDVVSILIIEGGKAFGIFPRTETE